MQTDHITLVRGMEDDNGENMPVGRERKGSWGEAILTGGQDVASIHSYLQTLAAKAEQKRKEQKKKRKERRSLKDQKRRKRSRSSKEAATKIGLDRLSATTTATANQQETHPTAMSLSSSRDHLQAHVQSYPAHSASPVEDLSIAAQYPHSLPPSTYWTTTGTTNGEFFNPHPASLSMSTVSFTPLTEPGNGDASSVQWAAAVAQQQQQQHAAWGYPQQLALTDDSFLSTFLSEDMLQADDEALFLR